MRIKHLFFMAITAMFAFTACDDPINGDDPGNGGNDSETNFWATYPKAPEGVKSITEYNFTENYDSNGRLVSTSSSYGSEKYTYNAEGYVSKIESVEEYGEEHNELTETYEYKNGDKFCPYPMGPGSVFHIFEQGLAKGLSKITFESEEDGTIVMEYKFQADKLTISTSGGNRTMIDSTGQEVPMVYDDIVIEYEGNYPRYSKNEHEFIGPITYQDNGQFDIYIEGFFSWDPSYPDFVYLERTRTVNKIFKDKLLVDKEVTKSWNDGETTPWNIETITYTYNEKGDVIKMVTTNTSEHSENYETTYEYEYDSKGNWIKCTGQTRVTNDPEALPNDPWTSERKIVYY